MYHWYRNGDFRVKIFFVFSASYADILREEGVRILVNFATLGTKGKKEIPKGFPEVIVDSGGFQIQMGTATRMNSPSRLAINTKDKGLVKGDDMVWEKQPEVDAYALWLQTEVLPYHPEVTGYFNLDILGDGLKTLENQFAMEKYGLKPIPVWHLGEGEEYLQFYWKNYEYISVGGLVAGSSSKKQLRELTALLHQKYPGRKYHYFGIGITGTSVFQEARPYSVDFSTWSNPGRFGNEIVVDEKQLLKEVSLPQEVKDRLKGDKKTGRKPDYELMYKYLRESIERIKQLEYTIDSIHSDEHQRLMF